MGSHVRRYCQPVACVLLVLLCGCFEQGAQRDAIVALKKGDYDTAKTKVKAAMDEAPGIKKNDVAYKFNKLLFKYSWREYDHKSWDKSFDLMTAASAGAPGDLRMKWSDESKAIAKGYAGYHIGLAEAALKAKDIKTVIGEYEVARKAQNEQGARAQTEFEKWTKARKEFEDKLVATKGLIEKEQWADAATAIQDVLALDSSLSTACADLQKTLIENHYQAAVRDANALLAKKDYAKAFAKANEALGLSTGHLEAQDAKTQVQMAYAQSVRERQSDALKTDKRAALEDLAAQYDAFELRPDAQRLRTVLANRVEADKVTVHGVA